MDQVVQGPVAGEFGKRREIYADATGITHGGKSFRWQDAEWFGYSSTSNYVQTTVSGIKVGGPTGNGSIFIFTLGRGPLRKSWGVKKGSQMTVDFMHRDTGARDEVWSGLVDLAHQHLLPRLLSQTLGSIRAGQSVSIANEYTVNAQGLNYPRAKRALKWADVDVTVAGGRVRVQPMGRPITEGLQLDTDIPNALLIPSLHAELAPRG